MTKRNCVVLLTLFALAGAAAAADYDFFDGARYPGPVKKPGVDPYKVKSRRAGSGAALAPDDAAAMKTLKAKDFMGKPKES